MAAWSRSPRSRRRTKTAPSRPWTRERVRAAIEALPANQRTVITLRDVEGWQAADVCAALEISEANQRVLLHRARGKVRQALERYLEGA